MDEKTREALEGSIAKWQAIMDGTGVDEGTKNCPLCRIFHNEYREIEGSGCEGCPVKEDTGHSECHNSPYLEWASVTDKWPRLIENEEQKQAAQKELDFLISLRPKG